MYYRSQTGPNEVKKRQDELPKLDNRYEAQSHLFLPNIGMSHCQAGASFRLFPTYRWWSNKPGNPSPDVWKVLLAAKKVDLRFLASAIQRKGHQRVGRKLLGKHRPKLFCNLDSFLQLRLNNKKICQSEEIALVLSHRDV